MIAKLNRDPRLSNVVPLTKPKIRRAGREILDVWMEDQCSEYISPSLCSLRPPISSFYQERFNNLKQRRYGICAINDDWSSSFQQPSRLELLLEFDKLKKSSYTYKFDEFDKFYQIRENDNLDFLLSKFLHTPSHSILQFHSFLPIIIQ